MAACLTSPGSRVVQACVKDITPGTQAWDQVKHRTWHLHLDTWSPGTCTWMPGHLAIWHLHLDT